MVLIRLAGMPGVLACGAGGAPDLTAGSELPEETELIGNEEGTREVTGLATDLEGLPRRSLPLELEGNALLVALARGLDFDRDLLARLQRHALHAVAELQAPMAQAVHQSREVSHRLAALHDRGEFDLGL